MSRNIARIVAIFSLFLCPFLLAETWEKTHRLTWNSGDSRNPVTTVDSNNILHVVWNDKTPATYEIFYRKSTNEGNDWSNKLRLTWNSGNSLSPDIAPDSSKNLHIVWSDASTGNEEIFYRKRNDSTSTWSKTKRLTWNSGESEGQKIAADSYNNLHLVWEDDTPGNDEIYYKRSANGGATWTTSQKLSWNAGHSQVPSLAIDSGNNIHVVWRDDSAGNNEIFYRKSTDGGNNWGQTKRLTWTPENSQRPVIAIDSDDYIHVAWHDSVPGNFEIYYKKSMDGGNSWTTKRITWSIGNSYRAALAVDSADNLHLTWLDDTIGNNEMYYRRSSDQGSSWEKSERLTWSAYPSYNPCIGTDVKNNIHIFWDEYSTHPDIANNEIFYKKGKQ